MERDVYLRMREIERTHWWFTARREILTAEIERLGLPAYARILEAGCGTGGNLDMLRRFGQVQALEPDAESRDYVKATKGIEVQEAWLPDRMPAFDHRFDLIAALDVIEHVDDDKGAVAALAGLLDTPLRIGSYTVCGFSGGGMPVANAARAGQLRARQINLYDATYADWGDAAVQYRHSGARVKVFYTAPNRARAERLRGKPGVTVEASPTDHGGTVEYFFFR